MDPQKNLCISVKRAVEMSKAFVDLGAADWYLDVQQFNLSDSFLYSVAALSQRQQVGHDIGRALYAWEKEVAFSAVPRLDLGAGYGVLRPALKVACEAAESARLTGRLPDGPKINLFARALTEVSPQVPVGVVDGCVINGVVVDAHMCRLLSHGWSIKKQAFVTKKQPRTADDYTALGWLCASISDALNLGCQHRAQAALWTALWHIRRPGADRSKASRLESVRLSSYAVALRSLDKWWERSVFSE